MRVALDNEIRRVLLEFGYPGNHLRFGTERIQSPNPPVGRAALNPPAQRTQSALTTIDFAPGLPISRTSQLDLEYRVVGISQRGFDKNPFLSGDDPRTGDLRRRVDQQAKAGPALVAIDIGSDDFSLVQPPTQFPLAGGEQSIA